MSEVIGVRFKKAGKMYYFDPSDTKFEVGDGVIVETSRGVEYGEVVVANRELSEEKITKPLKKGVKKAEEKELKRLKENKEKERRAYQIGMEKIRKHELDMKLINVEYTFDNNKIIFYFTADGRVDFRELVKDLASVFKTRIELRQIGVRDETKMLGGLGPCGRPCCCAEFLGDFQPVSIKMAKEQSLSLSPTKISGLCGRLMCCLNYEHEYYEELSSKMPAINSEVITPDGTGTVMENNLLKQTVKVKIAMPDGTFDARIFNLDEIKITKRAKKKCDHCKKNNNNKANREEVPAEEVPEELKAVLDE